MRFEAFAVSRAAQCLDVRSFSSARTTISSCVGPSVCRSAGRGGQSAEYCFCSQSVGAVGLRRCGLQAGANVPSTLLHRVRRIAINSGVPRLLLLLLLLLRRRQRRMTTPGRPAGHQQTDVSSRSRLRPPQLTALIHHRRPLPTLTAPLTSTATGHLTPAPLRTPAPVPEYYHYGQLPLVRVSGFG